VAARRRRERLLSPARRPVLLVEPAALATGLAGALRRAGLSTTAERAGRFARALALVPPDDRSRLYWTARIAFVSDVGQLATFDRVFAAVFDGSVDLADGRGEASDAATGPRRTPDRTLPHDGRPVPRPAAGGEAAGPRPGRPDAGAGDPGADAAPAVLAAASPDERLRRAAFAELTEAELAAVRRLVRRLELATPPRRTRRTHRSARAADPVDVRRSLRLAQRTAGDPVRLAHRRRRLRPRRLVLLCDVSASMEPYTPVYVALLQGAVSGLRADAYVFATRLTRLSRVLADRDPDRALERAGTAAPDWAGGTRLADSLRRFVTDHGRRGAARGAVVVIFSDGWERDDPEKVATQMARLRRLAHRIVWVNPRKAAPGYAPLVGGMAAALPYCDGFTSGHSLEALAELAATVAAARMPGRGTGTPGRRLLPGRPIEHTERMTGNEPYVPPRAEPEPADHDRSGPTVVEGVDTAADGSPHGGVLQPPEESKPTTAPVEQVGGDPAMTGGQVLGDDDGGDDPSDVPVTRTPEAPVSGGAQSLPGRRVSDIVAGSDEPEDGRAR
jgi:uncharacterized protein